MAHILDTDEGDITGVSRNMDAPTANWLKSHKLGHVMSAFAHEGLTIEELREMDAESVDTILDDLVNDTNVVNFKKRDKIRIKSKLKSEQKRKQQRHPQTQPKAQRVIVTEAETTALESLDVKYKELTSQKTSIEDRLRGFENEYIKQRKILNVSFDKIAANVEKRRNVLLYEMKQRSDEYKTKLSQRMKSVANQRNVLSTIRNKCEQKINNSSATTLQAARQRANKTVQLIDETLLCIQHNHSFMRANDKINVQFDIDESIHDGIREWGLVKMIGDKPPHPKINFVQVSQNTVVIELLCDLSFNSSASIVKYEINISPKIDEAHEPEFEREREPESDDDNDYDNKYDVHVLHRGRNTNTQIMDDAYANYDDYDDSDDSIFKPIKPQQRQQWPEVKQNNEYSTKEITNTNEQNVAFYSLTGLNQGTEYRIRGRVMLKDGQIGPWSQWSLVVTTVPQKKSGKKFKPRKNPYSLPTQNNGNCNINAWCKLCNGFGVKWTLLQQQRLFYVATWIDGGQYISSDVYRQHRKYRQTGVCVDFGNFRIFMGLRLHCSEWIQLQKEMRNLSV